MKSHCLKEYHVVTKYRMIHTISKYSLQYLVKMITWYSIDIWQYWNMIWTISKWNQFSFFLAKEKDNNRKHKTHSSNNGIDESDSSRCILEFKANESRSGMMNSNNLPKLKNRACTIIFRGNPGDVLLLHLETYKLR